MSMPYNLISIVVPALNESKSLEELYDRIDVVLKGIDQKFEFIVIDDGSTDGSLEKLKSMRKDHSNIGIIHHNTPHGKSQALMQGFEMARGEIALTLDADLQDLPEDIPLFLKKLEEGYDFVNGWRVDRKDTKIKNIVSMVFNSLTQKIFKTDVHDINCGFKAFRYEVYKTIELRGDLHRLIPILINQKGFKVGEVAVSHAERKYGESRYRILRHRGILDIISLIGTSATKLRPFHFFSEMAFIVLCLALLFFGGYLGVSEFLLNDDFVWRIIAKFLGYLSIWLIFIGTIMPFFGFLLEFMSIHYQDQNWRNKLVKERIYPENSDRQHSKGI